MNSDAVAFAVLTYAYSTEGVNGVEGIPVPGKFTIPAPAGPETPSPDLSVATTATTTSDVAR